ncbi:MAG TPA: glycoside hydrolase family 9 protein, partial [Cyclobacteriaceae bacterium]|nr:glycoside hydrolase family 9 protein [Cyclobacteriaceae bacterium]
MKIFKINLENFYLALIFLSLSACVENDSGNLAINEQEYFEMPGLNVMVYHDFYPSGHQSGVTLIQNGTRVAANGDIRIVSADRPSPVYGERKIDLENNEISIDVGYPDSMRNIVQDPRFPLPDAQFITTVRVKGEGNSIRISVDLDKPLPQEWAGKVVFRMELFPGSYFDRSYYMDNVPGLFPRQANGPLTRNSDGNFEIEPLARGRKLVVVPESPDEMITFESPKGELELVDGRARARNGWYVVMSALQGDQTKNVLEWVITAAIKPGYEYQPVIQISQIGYRENQSKVAVIELDKRVKEAGEISLFRISENGGFETVKSGKPEWWGSFLRYNYARFDFTDVTESGMYKLKYGNTISEPFMINNNVYKRHAWQPTLEYYLPVQMCHMRINQLSKVWHGLCHVDDALMAPVDHIHFDGYRQGPSTLTAFKPAQPVPGLNAGGWHDAGDYDLRVESQAVTTRVLCWAWELFKPETDVTTVDQEHKLVEIHVPDGKADILQQIEHGALSVVGGYKALGRLYRGIIEPTGRQYSLLGDGSVMTDNLVYDASLDTGEVRIGRSGIKDDRWVFTEDNPRREIQVAACMANTYRSLKG